MNSVTPINISGKTPEAGLQKHAAKKSHSKTHPAFRRNEDDILIEDDAVAAATSLSTTSSTTAATEPRWPHTTTGTGEMNSDSEQFIVNKAPTTATASAPRTENIQIIDIKLLKPNPLNFTLYGEEPVDEELMSSIKEYGIQEPLICTSDYIQISGHRRLKASRALCLTEVPVIIRTFKDETEMKAALLESNRQRVKTNIALGKEAILRKQIASDLAKTRQQQAGATKATQTKTTEVKADQKTKGSARDQTGAHFGMSGVSIDRLISSVNALQKLEADGRPEEAALLESKINKSVNAGYKEGIKIGVITKPEPKKKAESKTANEEKPGHTSPKPPVQTPAPSLKDAEPSPYDSRADLPAIEDHAHAMKVMQQIISYAEDMGGDDISDQQNVEWVQSRQCPKIPPTPSMPN